MRTFISKESQEQVHKIKLTDSKDEWFEKAETIGVTSGASVPEILVDDLLKHLTSLGYHDVQEVRATEETLLFALPKELRADLKAAK